MALSVDHMKLYIGLMYTYAFHGNYLHLFQMVPNEIVVVWVVLCLHSYCCLVHAGMLVCGMSWMISGNFDWVAREEGLSHKQ